MPLHMQSASVLSKLCNFISTSAIAMRNLAP